MLYIYTCTCGSKLHTDIGADTKLDQMVCSSCTRPWAAATSMPQCQLPLFGPTAEPNSDLKPATLVPRSGPGGRKAGGAADGTDDLSAAQPLTRQEQALKKIETILTEGVR
jgi:hypothetical protein